MSKNDTEYSLVGHGVSHVSEFDEYRNDAHRVIILRNIEKLDGEFILAAPADILKQVIECE
jgi:hypothetical protein